MPHSIKKWGARKRPPRGDSKRNAILVAVRPLPAVTSRPGEVPLATGLARQSGGHVAGGNHLLVGPVGGLEGLIGIRPEHPTNRGGGCHRRGRRRQRRGEERRGRG